MSSADWLWVFMEASATLLVQVSVQLMVGHAFKAFHKKVPKESLWLVFLYGVTPVLLFPFHENTHLTLLSVSLGMAYVLGFNPASGIRSPSLRILGALLESKTPISRQVIEKELAQDQILERKLQDLVSDGWITINGDRAQLSWVANAMVKIFKTFRRALNLKEGTG